MGCDEIRDMMAMVAGGDAPENERIAVEAHVGMCAECRCEFEKYRESRAALAGLREGDAPAGTFERIWNRVRDEVLPRRRALSLDWAIRIAAVLVIGLAIGYALPVVSERSTPNAPVVDQPGELKGGPTSGDPARPAGVGPSPGYEGSIMISPRPRLRAGKPLRLDGNYYLPHVEAILSSDEVDF